jgi:hypothetical protein
MLTGDGAACDLIPSRAFAYVPVALASPPTTAARRAEPRGPGRGHSLIGAVPGQLTGQLSLTAPLTAIRQMRPAGGGNIQTIDALLAGVPLTLATRRPSRGSPATWSWDHGRPERPDGIG